MNLQIIDDISRDELRMSIVTLTFWENRQEGLLSIAEDLNLAKILKVENCENDAGS